MLDVKAMVIGCASYLKENPKELLRAARNAFRLRFGLPIDALTWLLGELETEKGPRDFELAACPPGIRITATVEEMGTLLRGSAVVTVTSVEIAPESLRVTVKLADVSVGLQGSEIATPLAALIRSGALDLTRVANLVAHLPTRPAILVEAADDRLVLDFMRHPKIAGEPRLRQVVAITAQLLQVDAVETDASHLDVSLRALPQGLSALFASLGQKA